MFACQNNDSVGDSDDDTCSSYYDSNPGGCGNYDTNTFIASSLCCACGGGITGDYITTVFENDVALIKLAVSLDIDIYKTVNLPEVNANYDGKLKTYYGESTFSYK